MRTAVEWLYNQLSINNIALNQGTKAHQKMEQKFFEQAKEMEKEQMINARQSGIDATINGKSISNIDYYNETFKSE